MRTALVGHTGFVGSNLLRQASFDDCFNSRTIAEIRGRSYGNDTFAASVGALKGRRVLPAPSNLGALYPREVRALLAEYRADRVYATRPELARLVPGLRPDGCLPGLYVL